MSKVTIGMTTHNCLNATKMTLESMFRYTNGVFNVIMVDNLSTDGTREYLEAFAKRTIGQGYFKNIFLEQNWGCARSFNEVFKAAAEDDYIILANNDISFTPDWIKNLIAYMEKHPEVGIASPHPIDNHINDETKLKWFGDIKTNYDRAGVVHDDWFKYAEVVEKSKDEELDGFHGSAFCVTKECRDRVGMFDEQFLKGCWEDVDYAYRTLKAGFLLKVTNSSVIYHAGGTTQYHVTVHEGGNSYQMINRGLFEKKWGINTSSLVCSRGLLWDNSVPNVNTRICL